ncbi:MAG: MFS transporter [Oligoflexus sp.]
MTQVIISIIALFFSLVLLVVGNGMVGTLLAIRLGLAGIATSQAGVVLALYSVGFVIGSIYGPRLVKRVGHIRSFATFGAIVTAAILIHPMYISVTSWMLLRLVVGFCVAGLMLVTESWVNARATAQTRGTLLAIYMIIFYLAAASGQFLLALGDAEHYHLFLFAAILVTLSLVPISLTRSPAPDLHESPRMSLRELWQVSPASLSVAVLSGTVISAFSAVGPIYAIQVGLETTEVAKFMGVAILSAMIFQWPIGFLSDYFQRSRIIFFVALASIS